MDLKHISSSLEHLFNIKAKSEWIVLNPKSKPKHFKTIQL